MKPTEVIEHVCIGVCRKTAYCCVRFFCYTHAYFPMIQAQKKQPKKVFEAVLIGKQLRYVRRIKDISQETLAKQCGVTVGWIGRIERGIHLPNIKLLVKIARALQVKVKHLIPNELE